LEERWQSRLKDAELRYAQARQQFRDILRTLPPGEIPAPDGNYAYQQALRAERIALTEYIRVLRIFTDLAVGGKIPDEAA